MGRKQSHPSFVASRISPSRAMINSASANRSFKVAYVTPKYCTTPSSTFPLIHPSDEVFIVAVILILRWSRLPYTGLRQHKMINCKVENKRKLKQLLIMPTLSNTTGCVGARQLNYNGSTTVNVSFIWEMHIKGTFIVELTRLRICVVTEHSVRRAVVLDNA